MSQNIILAALMPETGTADKPVISVLVPCDSPTHGFLSRKCCLRHVIDRSTFPAKCGKGCSTPMFAPDRFSPIMTFCLLALSVQYQPLEREAPQGGLFPSVMSSTSFQLKTLPVKRIREANHQCSDLRFTVCGHSVFTLLN